MQEFWDDSKLNLCTKHIHFCLLISHLFFLSYLCFFFFYLFLSLLHRINKIHLFVLICQVNVVEKFNLDQVIWINYMRLIFDKV